MLSNSRRIVYLLIVISVGQVLLISAQVQSKSGVPVLETLAVGSFSQVQRVTSWFGGGVHGIWSHYFALHGAALENEQLKQKNIELQGIIQAQQANITRTQALEAALGLQQTAVPDLQAARVIAGSPSPDSMTVTIDQGSANGIHADMAVICAQGVVGRVIKNGLTGSTAQVQLLIHRQASAAVKLEKNGAGAGNALGGASDPPLHLEQVPNLIDMGKGDRLLTSGLDGIFPPGFLIGSVEKAELVNVARRVVTVRPAVDFTNLDIVLVVRTQMGNGR